MSDIRTIKTANSVYELDEAAGRVRRVSGINAPTSNFEEDGKWHDLDGCSFQFNSYTFFFAKGGVTLTSEVTE